MGDSMRIEDTVAYALARRDRLDPDAPVSAEGSIVIARPAVEVWKLLREVDNWPRIRGDVHDVVVEGGAEGHAFRWFAGNVPVRSRFAILEKGRRLTWATQAAGLEAVHLYRFEAAAGQTRLSAAESMSGPVAMQAITSALLARQIASWLAGLKALAER